ncbi:MAG: phosphate regulon sensor histidine kinase PhoR [Calditrichia bacterium]
MKTKKLFFRIFIRHVMLILLAVLVFYAIFSHQYSNAYKERLKQDLLNQAYLIKEIIEEKRDYNQIDSLVKTLSVTLGSRITIILDDGTVIAESEKNPQKLGDHSTRPEILRARSEDVGSAERYSISVKQSMLYVAFRTKLWDSKTIFIRTSKWLDVLNADLNNIRWLLLKIVFGIVALISLVTWYLTDSSLRKIYTIRDMVHTWFNGDLSKNIEVSGEDEITDLAHQLNQLTTKINVLIGRLENEKEEVHKIINGIREPLCVIASDDEILLTNDTFNKTFHYSGKKETQYWKILIAPDFLKLMNKIRQLKTTVSGEYRINSTVYELHLSYVENSGAVVTIFHDISERLRLEHIKKDFVANVSHELKTPLSSLKGYLELMESDSSVIPQFMPVLKRNTDRLIAIVDDLLRLSELEDSPYIAIEDEVDIEELIHKLYNSYSGRLKDEPIVFKCDIESGQKPLLVKGDEFFLEQMVTNLLDNAFRYTDKGEIHISVTTDRDKVIIRIADTGEGIPEDVLPRIFERFFVVDKARSRKKGGTGLGLSIVKHIVQLHNGVITVKSELEKGTQFIITLPRLKK